MVKDYYLIGKSDFLSTSALDKFIQADMFVMRTIVRISELSILRILYVTDYQH